MKNNVVYDRLDDLYALGENNGGGINEIKGSPLLQVGSVVKSVQRGIRTVTLGGGNINTSVPISQVDLKKAVLITSIHGFSGMGGGIESGESYGYVGATLSANSVNISGSGMGNYGYTFNVSVSWTVIEFA